MSTLFNRRKALKTSAGLIAGSVFAFTQNGYAFSGNKAESKEDVGHLSLVKHGEMKTEKVIVWSVLNAADREVINRDMSELRSQYRYKPEIKYSTNDRFKVDMCNGMINYIKGNGKLKFEMRVFRLSNGTLSNLSPTAYNEKVLSLYDAMGIKDNPQGSLFIKAENAFGPSAEFNDRVLNSFSKEHRIVNPKKDDIIQLNDLISGIVFSIICKPDLGSVIKRKVNDHFKEVFGISGNIKDSMTIGDNINLKFIEV